MFGGVPIFRTQITWALQGCSFVWKKRLGVRIANNKLQLGRHGSFLGVPHCFRWAKSAWSPSHWSSCDFLPLKHHLDNRTVANLICIYIYICTINHPQWLAGSEWMVFRPWKKCATSFQIGIFSGTKNSKGDGQSWVPWQYGVPSNWLATKRCTFPASSCSFQSLHHLRTVFSILQDCFRTWNRMFSDSSGRF